MDGMKPQTFKLGPASVRISYSQAVPPPMRGKVRELSSFVTDAAHRGHGFARALMDQLMHDADELGLMLLVVVEPFDESPMDQQNLAQWYERMGFAVIQADPLVMARQPVVVH
jgi:N-acetylglutamate synthase-like GNAT family acetyltransferase